MHDVRYRAAILTRSALNSNVTPMQKIILLGVTRMFLNLFLCEMEVMLCSIDKELSEGK